jgi:amidase
MDQWMKNQMEAQVAEERTISNIQCLDFSIFRELMDDQTKKIDLAMSIAEIQTAFDKGIFTSEELVIAYIQEIEKRQEYHAVLALNPDVLEEARMYDQARINGVHLGDLHGIPILLKDNIGTKSPLQTTAGADVLKNAVREEDAILVQQLKAEGAIVLGKTNLSEWANFMSQPSINGFSTLGGYTHNAHGDFDVSGSSSGSACGMALHLAAATLGSETAGSIISPASQNGVVGFKPTWGRVSTEGVVPIAASLDVVGPITGCVQDAALVYSGMQADFDARELKWSKDALSGKRIGFVTGHLIEEDIRQGTDAILDQLKLDLESAGAKVIEIPIEQDAVALDILPVLFNEMRSGINAYLDSLGEGAPVKTLGEILAYNQADLKNRAPYGQALLEESNQIEISQRDAQALVAKNRALTQSALVKALESVDMIVSIGTELTTMYAMAGTPALTIPAGKRESGEPVGATFMVGENDTSDLFSYGYAYEQNRQEDTHGSHCDPL